MQFVFLGNMKEIAEIAMRPCENQILRQLSNNDQTISNHYTVK